jgi:hypothetical protein
MFLAVLLIMGIHSDYNLQLMVEHIQMECIADNQIECVDKGCRSTFKSMVHEEEPRCCCLPRRGAGPTACRRGAPGLLLVDEARWCRCLSRRGVVQGCRPWAMARGEQGRATGKGRGGGPARGAGRRAVARGELGPAPGSFTMRQSPSQCGQEKREGDFSCS